MATDGDFAYPDDLKDNESVKDLIQQSEISNFYEGCNVLVTGASGFLGRLLVEKLLRSCPGISKLTMIVRPKKGTAPKDRCKKLFDSIIFTRLKKERPKFQDTIRIMAGDAAALNFGLSEEDQQLLMDTHVIFHVAATVRFEEKLRVSVNINVRGTKELLRLAKRMPSVKAFVYVSTAFSHCVNKFIDEVHYEPPIENNKLLTLLDTLNDDQLEQIVPVLIGKWPNTYAFTKAVAEHAVLQDSVGVPTCIVRPSIVISTATEPIAGWTNNMYGATGIIAGISIGLIRSLYIIPEAKAEIIPADFVVANIIAAGWETAKNRPAIEPAPGSLSIPDVERVPVMNCVTSCQNPISWNLVLKYNADYGLQVPSDKVLWYYFVFFVRYRILHEILVIFLHTIPAIIVDTIAYLTGREPILRKAYKRVHKFDKLLSYFTTQEWRFCNNRVLKLWEKMGQTDRKLFLFNVDEIDWEGYFSYHIKGLRLYLVNDPMDTLEAGKRKYRKLKIAHYTLCTLLTLLFLWIAATLIRWL